jgi:N-acyl-D-aspartate/D-glutamate deacylase
MSRLSEATGRTVVYNNLGHTLRKPEQWKELMAQVEATQRKGIRAFPLCSPNSTTQNFTMKNTQVFRGSPTWHPILLASDADKLAAYRSPEVRRKLHEEVIEWKVEIPAAGFARNWYDYMWIEKPVLARNQVLKGLTIRQLADKQGKGIIDAFLDLVVEEELQTGFMQGELNVDEAAMAKILTFPGAIIGLSDGGAHVQFHGGYGYSTRFLGKWVREKQLMPLEQAVRRLTFESASVFGLYDRGLLRPGLAADICIFDPDTVRPLPEEVVHDFPAGGWRMREPAQGIYATVVNGEVLLENGKHTGALPGRILRNSRYQANRR